MGFALTLLVISLEVPKDPAAMLASMRGALPFVVCFAIFIQVWFRHWMFFRRYALLTPTVLALNTLLLLVILLYVYPLRFVFWLWLGDSGDSAHSRAARVITLEQIRQVFWLFGVGYAALSLIFALLHAHALAQRRALALSPPEICDTRNRMLGDLATLGVALSSISIAVFAPAEYVQYAGWCYALIGLVEFVQGMATGNVWRREQARLVHAAAPAKL